MLSQKQNTVIATVLVVLVIMLTVVLMLFFVQNNKLQKQAVMPTTQEKIETIENPTQGNSACAEEGESLSDVQDEGLQECCEGLISVASVGQESPTCHQEKNSNDEKPQVENYKVLELDVMFEVSSFDAEDMQYSFKKIGKNKETSCVYFSRQSEISFTGSYYVGSYGSLCRKPLSVWEATEGPRGEIILTSGSDVITSMWFHNWSFRSEEELNEYKKKYPEAIDAPSFLKSVNDTISLIDHN